MKVCIAEKQSVAKDIAEVIGAKSRKDGYFEGNGYCVTWTFGHLCTLKEAHEYSQQLKQWSLWSLPMIPPRFGIKLIADKGIEKQFGIIEQLIGKPRLSSTAAMPARKENSYSDGSCKKPLVPALYTGCGFRP